LNVKRERVTISTVTNGIFQEFIPVTGNVLPLTTRYLDAYEGGTVEQIFIRAGSQVRKGDKILKLSNTNLMITILNNEAQVSRASNDLRATRLQLERNRLELKRQRAEADYYLKRIKRKYDKYKVLYEEQLISKQEYQEYKDEYEFQTRRRKLTIESEEKDLNFRLQQIKQLEASVSRMQQNLDLVKKQLEYLVVRAPVSGLLTALGVEIGESIIRGRRLGLIDEQKGFRVRAEIDEHYIDRIQKGKKGTFEFSGKTYEMVVGKIFPQVQDNQFRVDLFFPEKEPQGLKQGLTLHISLQLSDKTEALLLDKGGFYQTTGGNWVFVVDSSGSYAVKRNIKIGRQNPRFFEVIGGLKPGEKVVTSSYENYGEVDRLIFK
jgi:HlyD family secretion protein